MRVQLQQNKTLNNTNNSVRREDRAGRISKPFPTHIFPTIISWYIYEILGITHTQFYMSGEGKSAWEVCPETQEVVCLQLDLPITGYQLGRLSLLLSRMHTIQNTWNKFPVFEDSEISLFKGWTDKHRGMIFNLFARRGRGSGIDD